MSERPERVEVAPVPVGPESKMKDVVQNMPKKYVDGMKNNNKLKSCCKKVNEHTVQRFKQPGDNAPDKLVMTCKCGRRHIRMAGSPMR